MSNSTCNMPWNFSEVPKLVARLLARAFGRHPFKVRRNKSEETISISWELGPTDEAVWDFVAKTFPRCDWKSHEYDPPGMIGGRFLHPYCYQTSRYDLFCCPVTDVPRLLAAGADIEEQNAMQHTPFEYAVKVWQEQRAVALWEAGADFSSCLPGGKFYGRKFSTPELRALIESHELATVMPLANGLAAALRL